MCMNEKVFLTTKCWRTAFAYLLFTYGGVSMAASFLSATKKRKMQSGQVSDEVPSMSTSGESRTNQSEVAVVFMSQNPRIPNQTV